ncbi:MAG: TlpA family protein disulfide reductase [gamma proteobacterium symbiont of Lucinoma myriamae]|nr:TlpA family protein disulfide reductase [gamma proteobacterium symbiont of Lucinoma myriamae]
MLIFFLFSVFGVTQADGLPPLTHRLTEINKNIPVPSLILQNMDEEIIDIKEFKNKVVVVNFWATWCPPCRREMGSLERLYQATKDNDVEILAVNIGENIDTVFSFMGTIEPSPNFQILFDPDGASMDHWKVRDLPTTFIISPNGTIAYKAVGGREFDHPDIQKNILNLSK